jgi:ribosomal protein S18 acetylase RimI-like enzyme
MAAPIIRLARDTDAHAIAVMSRCLIEVGLRGWSWDPLRVASAIHNRNTCVIVAQVDHNIAGFAIAEFGDTCMHLSLLAVAAPHQRSGIGRALVAWLEESALTAGITEMQLELRANNRGARFFYQTLGFEFARAVPGYYRGEETAFKLHRALGACAIGPTKS